MISFKTTKKETKLIEKIVKRAYDQFDDLDAMSLHMDLAVTHANGTPLNFQKLNDFNAFDFYHDIVGIMYNIDRQDGKLKNCFLPRCAENQTEL